MEEIILWESDCKTIRACEIALHEALKKLGLKAIVTINSEPPLIARNQLWGRLPVLEIQGLHLSLRPGCAFTVEELTRLFKKIFANQIQPNHRQNSFAVTKDASLKKTCEEERTVTLEGILLTDANFRSMLEHGTGVLFFYKKLCPNCKAQEKVIEKFLSANPEVQYFRIDSEECPEAMEYFATERVPTIFVLRDGRIMAKKVGLMNLREMNEFYQSA